MLLWPWHKPVATAPIRLLAWEPAYAAKAAQEMAKRQKQNKTKQKTKQNPQMGPNQTYKLLYSKGNCKQHEKTTYRMGENICQPGNRQGFNLQTMETSYFNLVFYRFLMMEGKLNEQVTGSKD